MPESTEQQAGGSDICVMCGGVDELASGDCARCTALELKQKLREVEADRDRWEQSAARQSKTCHALDVENKALRQRVVG